MIDRENTLKSKTTTFRRVQLIVIVVTLITPLVSLVSAPVKAVATSSSTCAQGGVCAVGDVGPGGGIVFYVSPSANGFISASPACAPTSLCKYLEAAPTSGSNAWTDSRYIWSDDTFGRTGATATAIGSGYANTSTIISQEGGRTNSAAFVSRAYRGPNNLSDWYLPSYDELGTLYSERVRVGVRYSADGDNYWTSSDEAYFGVYPFYLMMNFPFWTSNPKSESYYVRPIRAFGSAPAEVISVAAIGGVTAPVVGATPVTTVTSANGYTGTVTWSGSPTTFAGATTYTATITLTAAAGYTLTGVSANFFTVAGTSSSATNSINSGVITAAFPATAVGPATKGLMTTQPSGAVNGAAFTTQPVVRVTDVDGNTNTSFTGNVVASIATGTGTLSGNTTVAAVSGVATFTNLVITGTLGNFTLRFTPASLTTIDSSSFALEAPPAATNIAITRAAVGTQRGVAFTTQPQITIQYANNETVTASSAVVTATISSGGTLVGTTTATASSGVATFSNLGVDGTVGTTYTISYTALDLPIASATVTLTGTTCNGSTFVCQVGDIGPGGGIIFYVAPNNGTFTQIGASGTMCTTYCKYLEVAPNTWSGGSSDPSITWATDINSTLAGAFGTAIGAGYENSLKSVDQYGNVAATSAAVAAREYTPTVSGTTYTDWYLPSKDELNQLYLQKTAVGGVWAAVYWSSTESNANAAWTQNFGIGDPAAVSKDTNFYVRPVRAFGVTPTTISVAAIGGVTAPVVGATPVTTVTSANGYTGTVTWSGSPTTFAGATTYTATITLTAAAGYTLTGVSANFFTVAGTSSSATNSINSGVITAAFPATAVGPATKGLMTTQPSGAVNGAAFTTQPVVRVTDVDGNTNTSFTGNVVASIATGTGTLSGNTTVAAVSGVATFTNLVITGTLGNFTLRFTPASLTTIDSSSFALEAPPAATNIAITRAAVGTQRGVAFTTQPQITIQYANNETVTASSAVVTATISSGGTLVGTTTATASSGVATFSNLGVDGTVGTTYTISYTALDLPIASATVTLTGTTCNGSTFVCQVGDIGPGGGIIFYVAPNNGTFTQIGASGTMCTTYCKYLEAAPNTWSGGSSDPLLAWASNVDNQYPTTAIEGADGTAIGTGYKNSLDIAAQTSNVAASSAAVAVRGYNSIVSGTTYTDWFLPSKDELNQLFLQKATVGGFVGIGLYWSSSEYQPVAAYRQYFGDGSNELPDFKWHRRYVRPVRAFGVTPTTISVFAIGGVTAPVRGGTPVNAVTAANGYTGTVTWSGAPTIFAPSTVYTATITLTADTGYTLVGVAADSFTVAGATSVTHSFDSGVITAVFAATGADPIVQEVRTDPMLPITRPQVSISEAAIMCSIGTYSQRPSSSVFSLFEDGRHIGTIFSAVGDYLPDWIIPWATSATITRTATLTSASWVMSEAYQGKSITCSVLAYSNHATGLILSDVVVIN